MVKNNSSPRKKANRLIEENSPYLLQHAYNPVEWYPWGNEAFAKAQKKGAPVFLSIGYSSCHWCHVMEKESFADDEVAELLNRNYVPVKVDREERPDLDQFYMSACQAMTGHGGWPLTVILTPEGKPFFAGTYFPKRASRGMPGLMDVLNSISELWQQDQNRAISAGEELFNFIRERGKQDTFKDTSFSEEDLPGERLIEEAYQHFVNNFDESNGGFNGAPKFPSPHQLIFLLRYQKRRSEQEVLEAESGFKEDTAGHQARAMVKKTLRSMAWGGIFDQLGYGFHRYSTDERWLVPHFEKMLYDQATTSLACLEAYQATGDKEFAEVAEKVFTYVMEELMSPEGAFCSAEDADTEGEEGAYYVWTLEELIEALGEEKGELAAAYFGVKEEGNFESGRSVLHRPVELNELASKFGWNQEELEDTLEECRRILLEARQKRERPFLDDKIITSWNGMMMAALARGGALLNNDAYVKASQNVGDFILQNMLEDGRLMRRYRNGEAGVPAFLEDYACLNWGLLELYRVTLEKEHLHNAYRFTGEMLDLFLQEDGTLRFVGKDNEEEISPVAEAHDGAHPSGVSVAANLLIMLGRTIRDEEMEEKGRNILRAYGEEAARAPHGFTYLLCALDQALSPLEELIITGDREADEVQEMIQAVFRSYRPNLAYIFRPRELPEGHLLRELAPFLKDMVPLREEGRDATAYYCRGYQCLPPITEPSLLEDYMQERKQGV